MVSRANVVPGVHAFAQRSEFWIGNYLLARMNFAQLRIVGLFSHMHEMIVLGQSRSRLFYPDRAVAYFTLWNVSNNLHSTHTRTLTNPIKSVASCVAPLRLCEHMKLRSNVSERQCFVSLDFRRQRPNQGKQSCRPCVCAHARAHSKVDSFAVSPSRHVR